MSLKGGIFLTVTNTFCESFLNFGFSEAILMTINLAWLVSPLFIGLSGSTLCYTEMYLTLMRNVFSEIDHIFIFRASFLHSTSMPRPSTQTHLTTRSWIGRITCSCGGKNIFLSPITQLRFGWCLKNVPKTWSFPKHPSRPHPQILLRIHWSCWNLEKLAQVFLTYFGATMYCNVAFYSLQLVVQFRDSSIRQNGWIFRGGGRGGFSIKNIMMQSLVL